MIYPFAAGTGASGILAALVLGGAALMTRSPEGLPWLVPSLAAGGLLVVAEAFRRRMEAAGALRGMLLHLSRALALGAACAGMVPIKALLGFPPVLEALHWIVAGALTLFAARALWLNLRLATRLKTRAAKSAATANVLAAGVLFWAVLAGPPAAGVATTGALVYASVIAAAAIQLAALPRRFA